jgi:uncharacterized membrane protein
MTKRKLTLEKVLPYLLILTGIVGTICSFIISYEKLKLLENAGYQPSCNLNPIISCGSVMKSWQGSAFGFPNPWIGLVGFGILLTIGAGMLAGAKFKRWFWIGLQVGLTLALIFLGWLLYESIYQIHALCPYCLTVDIVTIFTFWYTTLYNLQTGAIKLPGGRRWQAFGKFLRNHHLDILVLVYLIIIFLIFNHFWYYFGSHLF